MTTTYAPQALFVYYLLHDEHGDNWLPEFTRMLTGTVHYLQAGSCMHYDLPANLGVVPALDRLTALALDFDMRIHTADTITLLEQAASDLSTAHPAADCDWAEDCTVCPPLTWLNSLIAAYRRLHAEATTTGDTTTTTTTGDATGTTGDHH